MAWLSISAIGLLRVFMPRTAAGLGALAVTAVLNRRGEVVYNQIGSVTPEVLAALYDDCFSYYDDAMSDLMMMMSEWFAQKEAPAA